MSSLTKPRATNKTCFRGAKADKDPMSEVWLRTNPRPYVPAALLCALAATAGGAVALDITGLGWPAWLRIAGGALAAVNVLALGGLIWVMRRPRLAYADGHLLVQVRHGRATRVPLKAVECFLLGQGPAYLSRRRERDSQVSTVVVRLSPKAEEFAHREVDPRLGAWCDSHITLRGTWCEPIDVDLVKRLNKRLGEVNRQRKAEAR
jgi:hypothetical protein